MAVVKSAGYELWSGVLGRARLVVAPMVDQSELAWRLLSRGYGAQLCYSPMLHAAVFRRDPIYRENHLPVCSHDRPLIVQFCANDPATLLEAAKMAAPHCDAVDINLGCPQSIAKRGHYGAFLQDEWDLVGSMVELLHRELSVPVTCKIRIFSEVEKTVKYAQMLERCGCQLLTVHGRTREQKGVAMGVASWDHIKAVKEGVSIPVFANGNIQYHSDIQRCFLATGADGVMTAEGNLFNPALFTGEQPLCWEVSELYLGLVRQHPCPISYVRGHLFKIWFHVLQQPEYQSFRERVGVARSLEDMEIITRELKSLILASVSGEELEGPYSMDSIPYWRCQPYIRKSIETGEKRPHPPGDSAQLEVVRAKRKRHKEARSENKSAAANKRQWSTCVECTGNPRGLRCEHARCKPCCRTLCRSERLNCSGHKFTSREANELSDRSPPHQ